MASTSVISDATRAAALVFGRLLAEDVQPFVERLQDADGLTTEQHFYAETAQRMLHELDQLDVGPDEGEDRDREALQRAHGEVWLTLAETGRIPRHYIEHVLGHVGDEGGYVGPPFVRNLLKTIQTAPDDEALDALSMACPEYVGLWRAYRDVPDAVVRLRAAVGSDR